jgi:hypothetical protein
VPALQSLNRNHFVFNFRASFSMLSRSILASCKYVDCQHEGFAFSFLAFSAKVMHDSTSSLSLTASKWFQEIFFNKIINPTNIILPKNKPNSN